MDPEGEFTPGETRDVCDTGMSSFLTVVLVANQQSRQIGTPTMGHEMSMGAMKTTRR